MGINLARGLASIFGMVLLHTVGLSQTTDLLRMEYTHIPENDFGISTSRYRALFNIPLKMGKENYLVAGSEYNTYRFEFNNPLPFPSNSLEELHIIDINLGYILKWNPSWRFVGIVTPRLASNFIEGIDNNDFLFNFSALVWKEKPDIDKPFRLILGLTFNSATGLPFPLPLINYQKRFHPNWSYSLGIPRMDLKYYIRKKHILQTALFLDGYFVNIQNDILLPGNVLGTTVSLSALVGAIGYQYKISKYISFYSLLGYSLTQEGLLRDGNRDRAFTLNDEGNIYLRTGFKISIF